MLKIKLNKSELMFYEELSKEEQEKIASHDRKDLFFYHDKILHNTSDFNLSTSDEYDGMKKLKDGGYMMITYLDDDCVDVSIQNA